jgi:multiple sugar transport system substrate-binding protein
MRQIVLALGLVALFVVGGCGRGGDEAGRADKLVIVWAKWEPADALAKLVQKYEEETGVKVTVDQIPWQGFQDRIRNTVWAGKSDEYDIIIGDSQWIGQGAVGGHYVELTDWMKQAIDMDQITPSALAAYGEYPAGSSRYYALPCESDAIGFAYRKDLFEDPKEKSAFQAKYGYELAPPKTWSQLRDIAEFFTRPNAQDPEKSLYGAALYYSKGYDGAAMGFEEVLWCFGGAWADPETGDPMGVINSEKAVQALQFYIDLLKFCPPGAEDSYYEETKNAFNKGLVAMAEEWFAFMPGIDDREQNQYHNVTGYFLSPSQVEHYVSLGGQGMSISTYSNRQTEAKKFLQWFAKEETQMEWAKLGGYTANMNVLASDEFKNAAPYNPIFSETVPLLRDFTNCPAYQEMLDVAQEKLNAAFTGQMTAREALDAIAEGQRQALVDAGLLTAK